MPKTIKIPAASPGDPRSVYTAAEAMVRAGLSVMRRVDHHRELR